MHIVESVMQVKNRPLIGILTITLEPLEDGYQVYADLGEEIEALDVGLVVFTPYGIDWMKETVRGLILKDGGWEPGVTRLPDAVYNRLYGTNSKTVAKLAKTLGNKCVFNHENRLSKIQVAETLHSSKLKANLPETSEFCWGQFADMLRKHNQVILKPIYGNYGFNIYKVVQTESRYKVYFETLRKPHCSFTELEQLRNWIEGMLVKPKPRPYLVQQYIEPLKLRGRFFDLRLLAQRDGAGKWAVTAVMSRINRLNYLISNLVYRITDGEDLLKDLGLPHLIRPLSEMSVEAAKLLTRKLGMFAEISVDWIVDQSYKPWIIEINGKPRKDLFEDYADDELLRAIHLRPISYGRYAALKKANRSHQGISRQVQGIHRPAAKWIVTTSR